MKLNSNRTFTNHVIGRAVRYYRDRAGLSQYELSFRTGIDQATLSRIEQGQSITVDKLIYIMDVLQVSPATFFRRLKNYKVSNTLRVVV